ncbi:MULTISPECIES: LysM peptidoglycan-binding domain-containing protein [unclassified Niallia]|uniref:LysM peptidoglycan-binding domain-containing protein n=1 Tax=unclassified Niallia TaxID=2837522 RepID=UPI001EDC18BD|nr:MULTISPECIES: LysM peptidoglycan-binding domain-containing protein [unclassified Niallia]MDL0435720.1 LysM peptidoglycan-binding domain-containing protein [Niallia sp. SS-2023]UPO86449.1 LysM peptidoglycan-binding domain-containing protein [Niallia sp. Man26]
MTREDPYRVQAERQKKRLSRLEESEKPAQPIPSRVTEELPSRRAVHHKKKKKKKKNQKYTGMTILAISFIALPVLLLGIHEMINRYSVDTVLSVNSSSNQFEQIGVEQKGSSSATGNVTVEKEDSEAEEKPDETAKEQAASAEQEEKEVAKQKETAQQKEEAAKKQETEQQKEEATKKQKTAAEQEKTTADSQAEKAAASEVEKQEPVEKTETENAEAASQQSVIYHTVAANETLYRIAMKYYNSKTGIEIIKQANQLTSDNVLAGQVLKIPQ